MAMLVTHSLTALTHSLTKSRLVNLIDVTLACEDAYSKLVYVVTVADFLSYIFSVSEKIQRLYIWL